MLPGAFWYAMDFTSGMPVKEETLEVRVPRALSLLVKGKKVQPVVSDEGDERVTGGSTRQLQSIRRSRRQIRPRR
jgi:hypothetical protein